MKKWMLLMVAMLMTAGVLRGNEKDLTLVEVISVDHDIVIGDVFPLKGILTIPAGEKGFPLVILVHGSGPHDRDETIGPNKPFRDIANGLAKRGVATLRYDKRTFTHGVKLLGKEISLKDEVTDDAVFAFEFARKQPEVDPARIFILGHSLGGVMMPRIAEETPDAAGYIMMGASARPLSVVLDEQLRYIAEVSKIPDVDTFVAKQTEAMRKSVPPGYWREFTTYVGLDDAEKITKPVMLLQGGRDYQVTDEDSAIWRKRFGDWKNFTFRHYADLNHMMQAGEGKATPQEYAKAAPVSDQVISDIAAFVSR